MNNLPSETKKKLGFLWLTMRGTLRILQWGTLIMLTLCLLQVPWAEAKRKRAYRPPPLKVLNVSMNPIPFIPGKHPLEITVEVELPSKKEGEKENCQNLLEVSSLISFPSKRSIRFLAHRQHVVLTPQQTSTQHAHSVLLWDGKDQRDEFVEAGQYEYEVRAKLMVIREDGPRTTMVSVRTRGEFEVKPPQQPTHKDKENPAYPKYFQPVPDETQADTLEHTDKTK